MLDLYYASEKPLPRQQEKIYRLVGAKTHADKMAIDVVLVEFWKESADGWRNARADAEIARSKEKSEVARKSAEQRWHPERNANAMRTQCDGNAPNSQEPITKEKKGANALPSWVPEDAWRSWLEVRSRVKAPNTARALTLALRDLERLKNEGNDPRTVLETATVKGWRGLFPVKSQTQPVKYDL